MVNPKGMEPFDRLAVTIGMKGGLQGAYSAF